MSEAGRTKTIAAGNRRLREVWQVNAPARTLFSFSAATKAIATPRARFLFDRTHWLAEEETTKFGDY